VTTADVSQRNAEFWDELCGSHLARQLGIRDASPGELARFDAAYLAIYPYLLGYFPREQVAGRRVLDVGLGYGTLAEALARMGADYHGLDIATGPVEMARHRLAGVPGARPAQVQQGSVLELPFPDASFDLLASIGCLHHTGDLFGAIQEVRRVLRPGGRLAILEITRPRGVLAPFYRLWFDGLVPLLGRLLPGGSAYTYLPASVRRFPGPEELAALLRAAGFEDVRWRTFAGGIVALHIGVAT
jgi:ubiquinone/menaquinone biosynthesis methyltransferase